MTRPDAPAQLRGAGLDADVILPLGGASVGERDVLRPVLQGFGARILFDRIAVQPGKPCWHARFADGRLVLGLPGNPASAFVCAHLLLKPLLFALQDRAEPDRLIRAALTRDLPRGGDREVYWRARLVADEAGRLRVTPDERQDSGLQNSLGHGQCAGAAPAGRCGRSGRRPGRRADDRAPRLDSGIPLVAALILPIAALAETDPGEAVDGFDPHHIFGVLVAELALDPEAERRAVADLERAVVHRPGEQGLRVEGVDQIEALIIRDAVEIVGAVEDDEARLRPQSGAVQQQAQAECPSICRSRSIPRRNRGG